MKRILKILALQILSLSIICQELQCPYNYIPLGVHEGVFSCEINLPSYKKYSDKKRYNQLDECQEKNPQGCLYEYASYYPKCQPGYSTYWNSFFTLCVGSCPTGWEFKQQLSIHVCQQQVQELKK